MTALNFSKEAFKVVNRLENHASSREFLAAAENIMSRGDADLTAALLASEAHKALQCAASLSSLGVVLEFEKACLYSRPERRGTRLLVGFTGSAHRLMMPLF